ncbi:MAG: helix-turn-helix transcriptional regulator [Defluviitaleaceae bacterium]|nr:helix-turn-helix transcriptional regulator [Defluviitaleaceae bacterium]
MRPEQGALTEGVYLILLSLRHPRHGYGVMQDIERMTAGRVVLGAGTLYGAIGSLAEKGWIAAAGHSADSRKKEYAITDFGRRVLLAEMARLQELLAIGVSEMEGEANAN